MTEKFVFVTHLPCVGCAKRFINMGGVQKVFYSLEYRRKESIRILNEVGIEVVKLEFYQENKLPAQNLSTTQAPTRRAFLLCGKLMWKS